MFGLIKTHTVLGQPTLRALQANHLSSFVKQQKKRTLEQDAKQQWRLNAAKLSSSRSVLLCGKYLLRSINCGQHKAVTACFVKNLPFVPVLS